MASSYTHSLTTIEHECGVTLDAVAQLLPQLLLTENDTKIVFPRNTSAALASSAARCVFADKPAHFAGLNQLGQPVYALTTN